MATARDNDGGAGRRDRRRLGSDEAHLWRRAIADVRPIAPPASRPDASPEALPSAEPGRAAEPVREVTPTRPPSPPPTRELVRRSVAGLDKRTLIRLRRGLIAPETQVDLHRQTQDEARRSLDGFLAASQATGRRCVLVITGKGYGSGGAGILKTMVPRWLDEQPNRGRVLAFCHALPSHGGEGALYVLLRRVRT
jgi:DNA-nicking Smr family endonuclease